MVRLTAVARAHVEALERHYRDLGRDEAILRLTESLAMAMALIEEQDGDFSSAPRLYPDLGRLGWRCLKVHRYWVAFVEAPDAYVMTAVFYETANIPGRLQATVADRGIADERDSRDHAGA